eukprot:Seg1206.1 transcript_id=Seg1206.1/GoldUCD/mRNA.D3Y31 product="Apolipoprotein L3" protein_id=Seg1206.1/GoldUCD/D3Y31
MSVFFYIVASRTKRVITMNKASKGSRLSLSEFNPTSSNQLWKWDCGGLLMSKSVELVIDVKDKKTKDGAPLHAWSSHGNWNQKWQIVEGRIQNCSCDDLNITSLSDHSLAVWEAGDYIQKWTLVPEALWNSYALCIDNPNALMNVMFLKTTLSEHMAVIVGCSFEEYEKNLKECISINNKCADTLDEVATNVGIARVTGGSAGIAGGTASLIGLALAPFTAGVSLALTVGGAIAAGAGGLTVLGAAITDHCYNKDEMKKIKPVVDITVRTSLGLKSILSEICTKLEEANKFLQTAEGKSFYKDLYLYVKSGGKAATSTFKIGSAAYKGATAMRAIKDMKALATFIEADIYAVRAAMTGTAEFAAAGGLKIPLLGKVLIQAGSAGAKAFTASLAFLGIVFGIWDVVGGAKQISEGSKLAPEFRKSAEQIKKEGNDLIAIYKELFERR